MLKREKREITNLSKWAEGGRREGENRSSARPKQCCFTHGFARTTMHPPIRWEGGQSHLVYKGGLSAPQSMGLSINLTVGNRSISEEKATFPNA